VTLRIEPARRDDRRAIIDVLATAFHNDPPMLALLPDERRRPAALRQAYAIDVTRTALSLGASLVAREGDEVVGAALAFPPGRRRLQKLTDLLDAPRWVRVFGRQVRQAYDLNRGLHKEHPKSPHIYLLYLGATHSGCGIGGALLAALAVEADRQGLPMYLESSTPASARLYRRHGFADVRTFDHPLGTFTLMWREPRIPA
jgi:GNAT superfamily N-acetyltransferase